MGIEKAFHSTRLLLMVTVVALTLCVAVAGETPTVVSIDPPPDASDVSVAVGIRVVFNEPISEASVSTSSFVVQTCDEIVVPGDLSLSDDGTEALFLPDAALALSTWYFVSLTDQITDPDSNPLVPFNSAFLTTDDPSRGVVSSESIGTTVPGSQEFGETAGENFGRSVATIPDLNGDGIAEILVGAPRKDPNGIDSGAAYLIFGSTDLQSGGTGGRVTFNGEAAGDNAGFTVAAAGDINDDGTPDLMIGAPGNDGTDVGAGRSYVVLGGNHLTAGSTFALSNVGGSLAGVRIDGAEAGDQIGFSIAGGGDPNGDGINDLLFGAPFSNPIGMVDAGRAFYVFGPLASGTVDLGNVGGSVAGVVYEGDQAGDEAGRSVTFWIDSGITPDAGVDDIVIGAPGVDPTIDAVTYVDGGTTYIIRGGVAAFSESPVVLGRVANGGPDEIPGARIEGDQDGLELGSEVTTSPQPDDQGVSTVATEASGRGCDEGTLGYAWGNGQTRLNEIRNPSNSEGKVVRIGAVSLPHCPPGAFAAEPAQGVTAEGFSEAPVDFAEPVETIGVEVDLIGDVDGVPGEELVVGMPDQPIGPNDGAGAVYVISGTARPPGADIDLGDVGQSVPGFVIQGSEAGDAAGRALAGGADVNGDGMGDLLVGAPGANPPDPQAPGGTISDGGIAFVVSPSVPDLVGSGGAQPLAFSGESDDFLEWGAIDLATRYNVYRGQLSALRVDQRVFTSSMVCLASGVLEDSDMDALPDIFDPTLPPAQDGFFYLVTAENDAGEGGLGAASDGQLRVNNSPCADGVGTESIPGQGDSDGDTFVDLCDNCPMVPNPSQLDTDGDGAGDACDPDDDNDGLLDTEEIALGTDPLDPDSDNDGLSDYDEVRIHGTDPNDADSDNDGVNDDQEVREGSDPLEPDTDMDTVNDGMDNCPLVPNQPQQDTDGDDVGDACEMTLRAWTLSGAGGSYLNIGTGTRF